jgi:hypothetical protein
MCYGFLNILSELGGIMSSILVFIQLIVEFFGQNSLLIKSLRHIYKSRDN